MLRTHRLSQGIVTYNAWPAHLASEPWTIYITSTEFCYHNQQLSNTGRASPDIGIHAPCTTHRPSLTTSSHTLLHTYRPNVGTVAYTAGPEPVAYEPWTIYITSTEFCYHNSQVSTIGRPSVNIGRHASYTTHRPSPAASSHTMSRTPWQRLWIVTLATYTTRGPGWWILSHGPYTANRPSLAIITHRCEEQMQRIGQALLPVATHCY